VTDREILYKAYEKAYKDNFATDVFEHDVIDYHGDGSLSEDQYLRDIFSHDFAKAFWGEEKIVVEYNDPFEAKTEEAWKIYLQQMVLEVDRLKYLEKFLNEAKDG